MDIHHQLVDYQTTAGLLHLEEHQLLVFSNYLVVSQSQLEIENQRTYIPPRFEIVND